ncbi:MAG TPA: hypothetical protein VLZ07_06310 [Syntrophales bacterium]|nr:hypothetical protein [Syntrophales bacterium]
MKIQRLSKRSLFVVAMSAVLFATSPFFASQTFCAGLWDSIVEGYRLHTLPGKGEFVPSPPRTNLDNPNFPIEVVNDGYKMVRVYEDLMGNELVEWEWLATLRNKTPKELNFSLQYKLQDHDSFLLASSREQGRRIGPGETLTVQKKDALPYKDAERVSSSKLDIELL